MNNKPSNDELNNMNTRANPVDTDFIASKPDSERTPVQSNKNAFNDEVNDYIFLKSGKCKKAKHKRAYSHSHDSEDVTVVASYRRSSGSHNKKYRSPRRGKMKKWKKILLSVICTLLGLVIVFVGTISILWYKGSQEMGSSGYIITAPEGVSVQNQGEYVLYNGKTYKFNENITSILLMGIDKREFEETDVIGTGGQADVNVLMALDTSTGKITLINISRDTMTDVTQYSAGGAYVGMTTEQLCLAFAYGDGRETSCENQVRAVQQLFYNLPIKSYYSLDLDGISSVNDIIGGIDVVSPETIGEFTEGESYHLEGSMAESFVRTRNQETADANSYRMERQQVYFESFMNKVISQTKQDIFTPLNLFNAASDYSCTNLNASKVCYLATAAISSGGMSYNIITVPGESKMGETYAEFYVDETEFYEMFLSVFYTQID